MRAGMGYDGIRWDFMGFLGIAVLLLIAAPSPSGAVELLQPGQAAPRQGILLDVPTSFKILQVLEDYPQVKEENALLREAVAKHESLDEIRQEREKLYQDRIRFLEDQSASWARLNEATLALAKQNREMQGSWWDRFVSDFGKYTFGAVIGGIAAAAIIF